jgi:hypothetical protein
MMLATAGGREGRREGRGEHGGFEGADFQSKEGHTAHNIISAKKRTSHPFIVARIRRTTNASS